MANLGRFQLGDFVPLKLRTVDGNGTYAFPTVANPTAAVFDMADLAAAVETVQLIVQDRYKRTGYFGKNHRLSSSYAAAKSYMVIYEWALSGTNYGDFDVFDVIAGGSSDGAVIGAEAYPRPEGEQVVYQLDGGKLLAGRNPR